MCELGELFDIAESKIFEKLRACTIQVWTARGFMSADDLDQTSLVERAHHGATVDTTNRRDFSSGHRLPVCDDCDTFDGCLAQARGTLSKQLP